MLASFKKIVTNSTSYVLQRTTNRWPFASRPELEIPAEYSMCTPLNLKRLHSLGQHLNEQNISGDVVECGVCNGGSAAAIALGIGQPNICHTQFHLFDSFQGMPPTAAIDGRQASRHVGDCVGSVEKVKEVFDRIGFPPQNLHIHEGWFDITFPAATIPDKIAFLHIDADWYDSVSLSLDTFFDRVVSGGIVMLDDFGYWEGCREAFYDFCERRSLRPLLERTDLDQAYWFKDRVHNRRTKR